ncbi:MAG: hypothetical protein COA41_12230 [Sphingopyxis sp.]|nr:MAG: hypothetical protein COA41_12230 [Sphingopyxis sp.]
MQPDRPILSIIVPYRNGLDDLKRLLESCANARVRVYVVDDNSDADQSAALLASQFPGVTFLKNDTHLHNAGCARNIALARAETEWVFFADADDYFVANGISSLLGQLGNNDDNDVIYFPPTSLNERTGQTGQRHAYYAGLCQTFAEEKDPDLFLTFYVPWSKAVRLSLIRNHGIRFDEIVASNDINFSAKVAIFSSNPTVASSPVYCATENGTSLTSSITPLKAVSRLKALTGYNLLLMQNKKPARFMLNGKRYLYRSLPLAISGNGDAIGTILHYLKQLPSFAAYRYLP